MACAGIYGLGKAYLPSPVKTCLSYAATPITRTAKKVASKVFGWNTIWDFLADENSMCQWLLTDVVMGRGMGFSGGGDTAKMETALMSQTFMLTKARVLAREKKEPFGKEDEYNEKIKKLYERIKTPKSFTLNLSIYLAETVATKMPGISTGITQDQITFAAGAGLGHLTPKILKAGLMLFVKHAYLGGSMSMSMDANSITSLIDQSGDEMMTAYSYWNKIMAMYQKEKMVKRAAEMRRRRSEMKGMPVVDIKMAEVPAYYVEPMPELFVKVKSSARASMDLWVFLMMIAMMAAVCYAAFKSGMGAAPTSSFPDNINPDNGMDPRCTGGDVYDMRPTRDVAGELEVADMML